MTTNELTKMAQELQREISGLQSKLSRLAVQIQKLPESTTAPPILKAEIATSQTPLVTIECDGGTSCNRPGDFGYGYGSYSIDGNEPVRVEFGKGHSNNSAEVLIMVAALKELARQVDRGPIRVLVRSDSRNALKWVQLKTGKTSQISPKASAAYRDAVKLLLEAKARFPSIKGEWRNRLHSVALFGH